MESHGGRGVATIDITGAYLYTDNNDYLNMLIKGGVGRVDGYGGSRYLPKVCKNGGNGQTLIYVKVIRHCMAY